MIYVNIVTRFKNSIAIQVEDTDPISKIKEQLSHRLYVPQEEQLLIYEGKTLKDENTLSSENLKDGSQIHLTLIKPAVYRDLVSSLNDYLQGRCPTAQCAALSEQCLQRLGDLIDSLSLDEIERYAKYKCMESEMPATSSDM